MKSDTRSVSQWQLDLEEDEEPEDEEWEPGGEPEAMPHG
jgi:hypothetical protein